MLSSDPAFSEAPAVEVLGLLLRAGRGAWLFTMTRTVGARTPGDLSGAHALTSPDWATGLEGGSGLPKLHNISGGTGTRTLVLT